MNRILQLAMAALAGSGTLAAVAQEAFPSRPITLIVPFAAGGAFDVVARLTAKEVGQELKQPVIVENKPGAGGVLGGRLVGNARPDGYTLLLSGVGPISIAPAVYKRMEYSPAKVLAPVAQLTVSPFVLVTSEQFKGATVKELVAFLKASPGAYNYASTGNGTLVHLAGEYFKARTGTDVLHVPFGGGAPATTSLLSRETLFSITNIPNVRSQIESGRLKGLATTGNRRSTALPQLPTISEAGIAPFDLTGWIGIFAPAGTPAPVIERLHAAYAKAMQDTELRSRLAQQGDEVATGSTSEFTAFLAGDAQKWRDIASNSKISLD